VNPPRPVVFDASIAVAWLVDEVESPKARRLPKGPSPLFAPTLVQLEVANALLMRLRRRLPCPPGYPEAALNELRSGAVAFVPDATLLDAAMALARRLLHPIYDCLYLTLARREEALLATFDRRLAALATQLAIPLWEPEPP
jgi:predicted nucleic acid-binding protein